MTCIVGIIKNNKVYLAGDSASSFDHMSDSINVKKVFHNVYNNDFIFGYTSSFRLGALLQYKFIPPENNWGWDFQRYIATDFINSLKECITEDNYDVRENGLKFLLGFKNNLIEIQNDYSFFFYSNENEFDSIGCGEQLAKGALSILVKDFNKYPEDILFESLNAVEKYDAYVKSPFHCVHT